MKTESKIAVTTPGEPCPGCGCPYPGDHTLDCKLATMGGTVEQRVRELEKRLLELAELTSRLANQLCKHQDSFLVLLNKLNNT